MHMEKKKTDELLQEIIQEKSFERFVDRNEQNFVTGEFTGYLNDLCRLKDMIPEHVIKAAQIDRTYGHQLFNGTRRPSRDKVIQLAFAFGLTVEETQEFLKVAGRNELYPRIKRDAAIIFGLSKHMNMQGIQEMLHSLGISILGE